MIQIYKTYKIYNIHQKNPYNINVIPDIIVSRSGDEIQFQNSDPICRSLEGAHKLHEIAV